MAITLRTVVNELNFIMSLAADNPKDDRLPQLLADAQTDLAKAAKTIIGDDPIISTGTSGN
jgi:hypothetical protein